MNEYKTLKEVQGQLNLGLTTFTFPLIKFIEDVSKNNDAECLLARATCGALAFTIADSDKKKAIKILKDAIKDLENL